MYIYICIINTYLWKKCNQPINVHVCMHACMYVWMQCIKKSQINIVLNEISTQLGMLCFAARFIWPYSLGNLTLRTSASWIWIQKASKTHDTHTHIYICYIYISLEKIKLSINVHVCVDCVDVCMDVCMDMDWTITNKQGFEWNMYTIWDASLQILCGRIPWGT